MMKSVSKPRYKFRIRCGNTYSLYLFLRLLVIISILWLTIESRSNLVSRNVGNFFAAKQLEQLRLRLCSIEATMNGLHNKFDSHKKYMEKYILEIINNKLEIPASRHDLEESKRLGTSNLQKPRPIFIQCRSLKLKYKILKNLKELSDSSINRLRGFI